MEETTGTSFARLATASTKNPLSLQVLQYTLFVYVLFSHEAGEVHLIPVPFINPCHKLYLANLVQPDHK